MLWLVEPTRTSWRKNCRVVNTFFAVLDIDLGLTDIEDTRGGDSGVDALCMTMWKTWGRNPEQSHEVIHSHLDAATPPRKENRKTQEHAHLYLAAYRVCPRSHCQKPSRDTANIVAYRQPANIYMLWFEMVGTARFELATYGTQNRRATRLRHAPTART